MKLTASNIVIGDITEASKYFSLVKQLKAEMKRLHGKDRPWMQSWQTVGPGVKVHIKLIMGEPKAYIYISRDVYAFGLHNWGQLGIGNLVPSSWLQFVLPSGNFALPIPTVILQEKYKAVSAGNQFGFMLSSTGELMFAGNNDCGQGGIGNELGQEAGIYSYGTPPIHGPAVHDSFDYGQLGPPYDHSSPHAHNYKILPYKVAGTFTDISAGGFHTLALNGTDLYIWGGYLLSNSSINIISYEPLLIGTDFVEISAGYNHSLMRKSNGDVYAMGINNSGQLGTGDSRVTNLFEPTLVGGGYKAISAGVTHSLAIADNGDVMAWGMDSLFIHFGLDSVPLGGYFLTPVSIEFSDCKAVCASYQYSYALKTNGDLYVLGEAPVEGYGSLGLGYPIEAVSQFTFVEGDFISISSVQQHSLAIKTNGDLYGWGSNNNGELGLINARSNSRAANNNDQPWDETIGRMLCSYIPTFIGDHFVKASAGYGSSLAVRYGPPDGNYPILKSPGNWYLP